MFMRRNRNSEGKDILEISKVYRGDEASIALAAFIFEAYVYSNGGNTPPGFDDHVLSMRDRASDDKKKDYEFPPPSSGYGEYKGNLPLQQGQGHSASGAFKKGANIDGIVVTTTYDALGVPNLSLNEESNIICVSQRGCTSRYQDMVWKDYDVYGLPKSSNDYPLEAIEYMVTTELRVYAHLRNVWGDLIPRFVYFGHDVASVWVLVTSYEGKSLSRIVDEKGGLSLSIKRNAQRSLMRLHALGVLHGDIALRNFLLREGDDKVLLIDFGLSAFVTEDNAHMKEEELQYLKEELDEVPTIEDDEESHENKKMERF